MIGRGRVVWPQGAAMTQASLPRRGAEHRQAQEWTYQIETLSVRILAPGEGATFLAFSGGATVHPRANRSADLRWFLDGLLLEPRAHGRLDVPPGRHELRCVDEAGRACSVRFRVR